MAENSESIQVGDTVWLKDDAGHPPMTVQEIKNNKATCTYPKVVGSKKAQKQVRASGSYFLTELTKEDQNKPMGGYMM